MLLKKITVNDLVTIITFFDFGAYCLTRNIVPIIEIFHYLLGTKIAFIKTAFICLNENHKAVYASLPVACTSFQSPGFLIWPSITLSSYYYDPIVNNQ
jgi:hypothetical protein